MLILADDSTWLGGLLAFAMASLLLIGGFKLARRPAAVGGRTLVAPSILILVVASVVAVIAWPTLRTRGLCDLEVLRGANINHAAVLALFCGVFGSIALAAWRRDPRKLAVALLVSAVLLSTSVALVSFDSAAYAVYVRYSAGDMFNCPEANTTAIHHVWYLYPVWGSAVTLLLLQAVRALRCPPLPTESETESGENNE